jgi:Calcineurin-like phosphoesterase
MSQRIGKGQGPSEAPKTMQAGAHRAAQPRAARATIKEGGDLAKLYREVGYAGPLEAPAGASRRARLSARTAEQGELGPLTPVGLRRLEQLFQEDRVGTLALIRKTLGYPLAEVEFRQMLAEGKQATGRPGAYVRLLRERRRFVQEDCRVPADLPTYPGIRVEPCSRRFEAVGDALGWLYNCGAYWIQQKLGVLERAPFPQHTQFPSGFIYRMQSPDGIPLGAADTITIALFSDFGTGEYQSLYMARALETCAPHYAVHLGDVYYAGTRSEVQDHLDKPLRPLLRKSRVFTLNANHEMLSGGHGYFEYLTKKRRPASGRVEQEQEGSYFCLWSDRYQVIAIDTAYDYSHDGEFLDPIQRSWLQERLAAGKAANPPRTNILLSQHEPLGLGAGRPTALWSQVAECAVRNGSWLVDFWFWGDEHYCALYEKTDHVPLVGSCIGHGGHPVDLRKVKEDAQRENSFAMPRWVDNSPRFTDLRSDELGNTGFCVLELAPSSVKVSYRDWLGRELRTFTF